MDYSRGRALSSAWVEVRNYRVNTAWGTNVRVGGGSRSLSRDGVRMGGLPADSGRRFHARTPRSPGKIKAEPNNCQGSQSRMFGYIVDDTPPAEMVF